MSSDPERVVERVLALITPLRPELSEEVRAFQKRILLDPALFTTLLKKPTSHETRNAGLFFETLVQVEKKALLKQGPVASLVREYLLVALRTNPYGWVGIPRSSLTNPDDLRIRLDGNTALITGVFEIKLRPTSKDGRQLGRIPIRLLELVEALNIVLPARQHPVIKGRALPLRIRKVKFDPNCVFYLVVPHGGTIQFPGWVLELSIFTWEEIRHINAARPWRLAAEIEENAQEANPRVSVAASTGQHVSSDAKETALPMTTTAKACATCNKALSFEGVRPFSYRGKFYDDPHGAEMMLRIGLPEITSGFETQLKTVDRIVGEWNSEPIVAAFIASIREAEGHATFGRPRDSLFTAQRARREALLDIMRLLVRRTQVYVAQNPNAVDALGVSDRFSEAQKGLDYYENDRDAFYRIGEAFGFVSNLAQLVADAQNAPEALERSVTSSKLTSTLSRLETRLNAAPQAITEASQTPSLEKEEEEQEQEDSEDLEEDEGDGADEAPATKTASEPSEDHLEIWDDPDALKERAEDYIAQMEAWEDQLVLLEHHVSRSRKTRAEADEESETIHREVELIEKKFDEITERLKYFSGQESATHPQARSREDIQSEIDGLVLELKKYRHMNVEDELTDEELEAHRVRIEDRKASLQAELAALPSEEAEEEEVPAQRVSASVSVETEPETKEEQETSPVSASVEEDAAKVVEGASSENSSAPVAQTSHEGSSEEQEAVHTEVEAFIPDREKPESARRPRSARPEVRRITVEPERRSSRPRPVPTREEDVAEPESASEGSNSLIPNLPAPIQLSEPHSVPVHTSGNLPEEETGPMAAQLQKKLGVESASPVGAQESPIHWRPSPESKIADFDPDYWARHRDEVTQADDHEHQEAEQPRMEEGESASDRAKGVLRGIGRVVKKGIDIASS